jgi:RNA polymerase sigma-70 factor (ECF subfamily)
MSDAAINPTPLSLLRQLRQPDPEKRSNAWCRFVQFYTPLLLLWARHLGAGDDEADDLVQDVFTVLVREMPGFQHDAGQRFRGWLWTILRNKWCDRGRQLAASPVFAGADGLATVAVPDNVAAFAHKEYQSYHIARALEIMQAELPPTEWQACRGYVVQGRPAAEVAHDLGISVNQVYLAKSRILGRLRLELEGLLD